MSWKWHICITLSIIIKKEFGFDLNILHGWWAMDFMICLASKYNGYSKLAKSCKFYPHLAQLDIIDVTLSHIQMSYAKFVSILHGSLTLLFCCLLKLTFAIRDAPLQCKTSFNQGKF